jgi:transposase-like protein
VFKEMRNNGYLDNLKELRHKVIARRLSLYEDFTNLKSLTDYLNLLNKLS